jgi:putative transposase
VSKFAFVAAERASHAVATLCRVVGASVSGFYAWLRAIPSRQNRAEADAALRGHISRIFAAKRRVYGAPRIHAELRREGHRHARRRIERLMRDMGLQAQRGRRRRPQTTDSRHDLPVAPNWLGRSFVAERPDTVWLADISYIPTDEGFLYLAALKDLATREIVGWSMADPLKTGLCIDALVMALQRCQPPRGLIHHSDRGVQGGFKWSSQHLDGGGCDEGWETALGSGATSRVAGVAGPTRRGAAGEPAAVLGGDCGGSVERGRGDRGRRVARGGGPLVPGGGRHATDDTCAISEAAIGAVSGVR